MFRYNNEKSCKAGKASMGELMDLGSAGLDGGLSLIGGIFSLIALGLYAFLQGNNENNDDDDSPGGGLMQPVA
jgi:hypothetical protein